LLIDSAADEVAGLLAPNFVGVVRRERPLMGEYLLLTFAPVTGLSRDEAARRRDELGFGRQSTAAADPVVGLWDMSRLIA
jgi:hypothetical protein